MNVQNCTKTTLMYMIGLPSSGKSTRAHRLIRDHKESIIFSSDELRQELFGDINNQDHNTEVFAELHKRIKFALSSGKYEYVIYDATNINSRRRTAFIRDIKNIDCYKVAIVMATPYEVCFASELV